jgi:hypothetical protein
VSYRVVCQIFTDDSNKRTVFIFRFKKSKILQGRCIDKPPNLCTKSENKGEAITELVMENLPSRVKQRMPLQKDECKLHKI